MVYDWVSVCVRARARALLCVYVCIYGCISKEAREIDIEHAGGSGLRLEERQDEERGRTTRTDCFLA